MRATLASRARAPAPGNRFRAMGRRRGRVIAGAIALGTAVLGARRARGRAPKSRSRRCPKGNNFACAQAQGPARPVRERCRARSRSRSAATARRSAKGARRSWPSPAGPGQEAIPFAEQFAELLGPIADDARSDRLRPARHRALARALVQGPEGARRARARPARSDRRMRRAAGAVAELLLDRRQRRRHRGDPARRGLRKARPLRDQLRHEGRRDVRPGLPAARRSADPRLGRPARRSRSRSTGPPSRRSRGCCARSACATPAGASRPTRSRDLAGCSRGCTTACPAIRAIGPKGDVATRVRHAPGAARTCCCSATSPVRCARPS